MLHLKNESVKKMKVHKILSGILAAVLLSGCGMPEMSFDNADSPIFREDSRKESRESTEKKDSSKPSLPDDGEAAESKAAQGMTESGKPESGKTESSDTESTKTDSRKTEPEKIYEDPASASALTFSRTVTAKDGKTSTELFAISTETNEISPEYEKLNRALKEIPEGEALPVRADTNVVSLIIREEPGSAELSSVNIDTETGNFLTISDIFSDTDKLASALKTQYGEDYPDLPALTAEELDPEQYIWTLSPDGCIFYFPDPEKKEIVNRTLLLRSANKDLFREKGTSVPNSAVRVFEINEDHIFDRDSDGTADRIRVSANPVEGLYKKAEVTLNGQSAQCYFTAFTVDRIVPVVMKTGDGCWLYLACEDSKGPGNIAVFDISKDIPENMGIPTGNTGIPYLAGEDGWTEILPGDPEAFLLESTVDLITSFPAVTEYKMDAEGLPKQTGEVYMAFGDTVLESLLKLKADLIDPDTGEPVEKSRTFKEGSRWTVLRSDGETYIEFDVNGEGLVRLTGNPSEGWPKKIGGAAADTLFKKVSDNS